MGAGCQGEKPDTTRGAGGQHGITSPREAQGRIVDDGKGRWPANLIHDGSDEVVGLFPESKDGTAVNRNRSPGIPNEVYGKGWDHSGKDEGYGGAGSAARFFYCAKASRKERNAGCEDIYWHRTKEDTRQVSLAEWETLPEKERAKGNIHPTVKPISLMRYLVRLITPPGGLVLDLFMGSGSTLLAAKAENFPAVGIDMEETSCVIAAARLTNKS